MGNNIFHSSIHSAQITRPLRNIHCRNRTCSECNEYYYHHRESVMANVRLIMLLYFIQGSLFSFFPTSRPLEG
jgi:hypothetical protein